MKTRSAMALMVAALGFGGNASATLIGRGPDMVYDDVLNITWTRQAGDRLILGGKGVLKILFSWLMRFRE